MTLYLAVLKNKRFSTLERHGVYRCCTRATLSQNVKPNISGEKNSGPRDHWSQKYLKVSRRKKEKEGGGGKRNKRKKMKQTKKEIKDQKGKKERWNY